MLLLSGIPFVQAHSGNLAYIVYITVLTVALIALCWLKGEPPRWRSKKRTS